MEVTKPKQVRVYLREPELKMLDDLVEITGMKDTAVLSLLCSAALKARHSEQMLFAHYHDLVTPEAAAEFWSITPK